MMVQIIKLIIVLLSLISLYSIVITNDLYIDYKLDVSQYNISLSSLSSSNYDIPFTYPFYKQCDNNWGNDIMVTKTICSVGCLMSSTSMAIYGTNILINNNQSNPQQLNNWCKNTPNCYDDSNDLSEVVVTQIDPSRIFWDDVTSMHRTNDLSFETIISYLQKGRIVIANVNSGHHFVLVTGYSTTGDNTYYVNDPGYDRNTYTYSEVVGYRIFDMIRNS